MAGSVETQLKNEGMSDETISDVQPLLANATFRKNAEAHIALANDAAQKAEKARSLTEDFHATIVDFITLTRAVKSISKSHPEVSAEMDQVLALAKTAMGKVNHNPQDKPVAPLVPVAPARTISTTVPPVKQ